MRLLFLTLLLLLCISTVYSTPVHRHRSHRLRHEESKSRSRRLVTDDTQASADHQLLLAKPYWPWP